MAELPRDWNQRYIDGETPWDSGEPSRELIRLLEQFSVQPCRVLEIGCGTGTNAVYLAERGFDVSACDISELAIEKAREKAEAAGVEVAFHVADLFSLSAMALLLAGGVFEFVFDRGVYHVLRQIDLVDFLAVLKRVLVPGGLYITLAGNANQQQPAKGGPPQVAAHELAMELAPLFELVQLREFHFDKVIIDGQEFDMLGWSAVLRRKGAPVTEANSA